MLVGKDFFVPRTEVAEYFVMRALDMAVKVWPTPTCNVAVVVWAVVPQEEKGICMNVFLGVFNSKRFVRLLEVSINEIFIPLVRIVCEDDEFSFGLPRLSGYTAIVTVEITHTTMRTSSCLVQRSQPQRTDVTGPVITGSNGIVDNRRGAYEANLCLHFFLLPLALRHCFPVALLHCGVSGRA